MANRFAVANGSFDDINTWSSTPGGTGGASVPGPGDVAHANGRTVAITNNIYVTALYNTNINGATAGGGFTCAVSDITLNIPLIEVSSSTSLISYSGSGTINIQSVSNSTTPNNSGSNYINNLSSGAINIQAAAAYTPGGASTFIRNSSTGTVSIDALVVNEVASNGNIVINSGTGSVYIQSGSIVGGQSATGYAVGNSSSGIVYIANSTIKGSSLGSAAGQGVSNLAAGSLTVVDSVIEASSTANAISVGTNGSAINRISGVFKHHANGTAPITGLKWSLGTTPTESYYRASLNGTNTFLNYYQAGSAAAGTNHAMPADVRYGTIYGPSNELTGYCHVPAAASVAAGVPVDNTVGTAVLTPAAVQAIVGAIVADAIDA